MTHTPRVPCAALLACLAFAPAAGALTLSHSGYLLDGDDAPLHQAGLSLGFSLWTTPSGGTRLWPVAGPAACAVDVVRGYYEVQLGATCGSGLTAGVLPSDGSSVYLQVEVGPVTLLPRGALHPAGTLAAGSVQNPQIADLAVTSSKVSSAAAPAGQALVSNGSGGATFGAVSYGDLSNVPSSFLPASHVHTFPDVTGLQAALDGKAAASHTHGIAQVTGLQSALDASSSASASAYVMIGGGATQSFSGEATLTFATAMQAKDITYNASNGEATVTRSGNYLWTGNIHVTVTPNNSRIALFPRVNGAEPNAGTRGYITPNVAAGGINVMHTVPLFLTAGQKVTVVIAAGSSCDVHPGPSFWSLTRVGDL